jgi:putative membrane protein
LPHAPLSSPGGDSTRRGSTGRGRRLLLLGLGAVLLAVILLASDAGAVWRLLVEVRFLAASVVAVHLLVVAAAALGWWFILPPPQRPTLAEAFRLRLIKEGINALLPVAQVGGDVARARLAASPALPLAAAAASCILDVVIGVACLALFICLGLALASGLTLDPRLHVLALRLAAVLATICLLLVLAEKIGAVSLLDRATRRWSEALGGLSDLGGELRRLSARKTSLAASVLWHLLSWGFGALETWTALWAVGAPDSLAKAFVLESLIQGVRAAGFAIPGALGVQEGGYLLICSSLGVQADQAVALSLLRRLREAVLGLTGLALWRVRRTRSAQAEQERAASRPA